MPLAGRCQHAGGAGFDVPRSAPLRGRLPPSVDPAITPRIVAAATRTDRTSNCLCSAVKVRNPGRAVVVEGV